jgi:hypothetical protein
MGAIYMIEFRWATKVLTGPWRVTRNQALLSAMEFGHASLNEGKGSVIMLRSFASIEERDIR